MVCCCIGASRTAECPACKGGETCAGETDSLPANMQSERQTQPSPAPPSCQNRWASSRVAKVWG